MAASITDMTMTRSHRQTILAHLERESAFVSALPREGLALFLGGEPDMARLVLRELVEATVGFENLSRATHKPNPSVQRMLSETGPPAWMTCQRSLAHSRPAWEWVWRFTPVQGGGRGIKALGGRRRGLDRSTEARSDSNRRHRHGSNSQPPLHQASTRPWGSPMPER
jgi:hypothetical protein